MSKVKDDKHQRKIVVGIAATSNRLETTTAVLSSLKNVENELQWRGPPFLKDVSALALSILSAIQVQYQWAFCQEWPLARIK